MFGCMRWRSQGPGVQPGPMESTSFLLIVDECVPDATDAFGVLTVHLHLSWFTFTFLIIYLSALSPLYSCLCAPLLHDGKSCCGFRYVGRRSPLSVSTQPGLNFKISSSPCKAGAKDHSEPLCPCERFGTRPERVTLSSASAGVNRP